MTRDEIFDIIKFHGGAWVFYRPVGGIGDAIMMLPAIHGVKSQAGSDLVIVSCVDYISPIFRNCPDVDYVLSYDESEIDKKLDEKDLSTLRDLGCEIIRFYRPDPAAEYESGNCPYLQRPFMKHAIPTGSSISKSRQEIFCSVAGVDFDINSYRLSVPEFESPLVASKYVVLQLRSHDKWRDYPYMGLLAGKLAKIGRKNGFDVVTIDSTLSLDRSDVISICNSSLEKVMSVVANAMFVVGPDSMGVHMAGAYKVPLLGLFGPTDPSVRLKYRNAYWMPRIGCQRQYCWYVPCKLKSCLTGWAMRPGVIAKYTERILFEEGFQNEMVLAEETL